MPSGLQVIVEPHQRALLQELVYGTLRWFYRLDAILAQLLKKPLKQRDGDVRCLLLTGVYQLSRMAVPSHVAINETVEAARELGKTWAASLVNAVLRTYQRNSMTLEAAAEESLQARFAHPDWLIARLQAEWADEWESILRAGNQRPPFCLRVNRQRIARDDYLLLLQRQGIDARPLPHCPSGVVLATPLPVEAVPGFADGLVSVQDGAAQQAAGLLGALAGQRVLDACAAPGGKTAHLLESEPDLRSLTAIDISERRLHMIDAGLSRLGLQAQVVQGDATDPDDWWDGRVFDRMLLDVPCSATGVIRRHPDIKLLRSPQGIRSLVATQAQILQALWPLLSTGGMLLYTTCSVLRDENERQIGRFLSDHPDAAEVGIEAPWGRCCTHGRQILPGENQMDGFYFACMRKIS
jgi:16S rRNA (cytosine967-C5)-methyltransferase